MPSGKAQAFALTIRPRDGWSDTTDMPALMKFLNTGCNQWQFYREYSTDLLTSAHLHGCILMSHEMRIDNLQRVLCRYFSHMDDAELKCLRRGVKYLYDTWEYAGKDGELYEDNLTDPDAWVFSTEADKKTKKGYNATQEYNRKADLFISQHGRVDYSVLTIMDVEAWYELQVLKGEFTYPTSDAIHKFFLKWLHKTIQYRAVHPPEV